VNKIEINPALTCGLKKLLCYLPIILLIFVALNQIRLAKTSSLSPWWGGGFGMSLLRIRVEPGISMHTQYDLAFDERLEIPFRQHIRRKELTFPF
jgi:hypothetical protein